MGTGYSSAGGRREEGGGRERHSVDCRDEYTLGYGRVEKRMGPGGGGGGGRGGGSPP